MPFRAARRNPQLVSWAGLQKAHIIGRSCYDYVGPRLYIMAYMQWRNHGLQRFITEDEPLEGYLGLRKIDSVQNAIILAGTIHGEWDEYFCGIDPYVHSHLLGGSY